MRKKLLAVLFAGALVFSVTPAFADNPTIPITGDDDLTEPAPDGAWAAWQNSYGVGNQWNQYEEGEEGADYWEWLPSTGNKYSNYTGPKSFGGMDIAAGYAEDGRFHKYPSDKNLGNNIPDIDGDYDVSASSALDKSQSRIEFKTDEALSAPLYSLPCPFEPLRDRSAQNMADGAAPNDKGGAPFDNPTFNSSHFDCSYVAGDPQTNDIGAATLDMAQGVVFDDLFQYMEDFTDSVYTGDFRVERHIGQDIDALFYVNRTSLTDLPEGPTVYSQGLGIDQTLDQDLADYEITTGGGPGNGMAQVLWQDFNLAKKNQLTNKGNILNNYGSEDNSTVLTNQLNDTDVNDNGDIRAAIDGTATTVGWIDQFVYSYMSDIEGEIENGMEDWDDDGDEELPGDAYANYPTNNDDDTESGDPAPNYGRQGVKTSYASKTVIVGVAGDVCTTMLSGCRVQEELGHSDVTYQGNVNSNSTIDKNVHHRTDQSIEDP